MIMIKLTTGLGFVPGPGTLHDHVVVGSALPARFFLVVQRVEEGDPRVVHGPMILELLGGPLTMRLGGGVVGGRYLTPKSVPRLAFSVNRIDGVQQPSINLFKRN